MKKQYRKLTPDQRSRGVIFSSQLLPGSVIHKVKATDEDREERIGRLLDDAFFNKSPFKVNEVRR